ncbi:VOC family protein [Croceibacterium sp. TMG7-5b_MA50]|uniref:2-oxoadipate dioxygenase/decarboxylase HglS n=1 Tax=Croceibacterium sp. TMG7-5b_MA50 TaxID=3121290 RepID=UPI0032217F2C
MSAMDQHVAPAAIRAAFSAAMSRMYRAEVPLYGDLLEIVAAVNAAVLSAQPALARQLAASGEGVRLGEERHGAIRVGTPAELRLLARLFAIMGMAPVGYYDLAPAGIPVHSTAFRATDAADLATSPFRVFTSLLRLELIADPDLRAKASAILADRRIVTDACVALIEEAEQEGGLHAGAADRFVAEALETFRWQGRALVNAATYDALLAQHRLVADIVAFPGPHINHLTPRTLDIDAAQAEMQRRGMAAKASIEGPPRREVPVLLRQTSFHALSESFVPLGAEGADAQHTARFGEIEQRGAALTPAGRALYDRCLQRAQDGETLADAFAGFPDDFGELFAAGLAYAQFLPTGRAGRADTIEQALANRLLAPAPLTYEDFLPVSAAGIFRSNLGEVAPETYAAGGSQAAFEAALGQPVRDPFKLYAAAQERSAAEALAKLA